VLDIPDVLSWGRYTGLVAVELRNLWRGDNIISPLFLFRTFTGLNRKHFLMRRLILAMLWLLPYVADSQECVSLIPETKIMGLEKRSNVNLDDMEPVTLPVVFHIVHKGESDATNISDEQIISQIPALDTGFRWGPGVDTKIQFCLASRDPEGNPTSGITRHNGVQLFGDLYDTWGVSTSSFISDGVNDNTLKSTVGCWNPDEYINFYVVSEINGNNGGGGIQGYAYVGGYANGPGGGCGDGIVQLYNVTGTTGTLKAGRYQGETGVHEMGHHLDLYHTFDGGNCNETNCETQGDKVCDTPPTTVNNACDPAFGECSIPPMTENFMDYTSEDCRYTFSVGQAERMWEHLLAEKQQLIDSYACIAPVDYDVAVTSAVYYDSWCTDFQDIFVNITNQGNLTIPSVDVKLTCNGESFIESVFDLDGSVAVIFEDVYVAGAQSFTVEVISAVDEYPDNDVEVFPIEYLEGDLLTIEVYKDFWACIGWDLLDPDGEIIIGDDYAAGENYYVYEACVYEGCYTIVADDCAGDGFCTIDTNDDGICDYGSEGIVGTVNGDTVFATGWGLEFFHWEQEWCNTAPACPLDYDGSGVVGNGDIVLMLGNWGCVSDGQTSCEYDANQDGQVNVLDLMYMLTVVGSCPPEEQLSYRELTETTEPLTDGGNDGGPPTIFDVSGRLVTTPYDQLASGIYIVKYGNITKKIFIQ
jgi:hypothetical protein